MPTPLSDFSTVIGICLNIIQGAAIIVGGIWTYKLFVQNREKYPKAAIKNTAVQKPLGDGKKLLHVAVCIENKSKVLMKLVSGEIRILQVTPLIEDIADNVSKNADPVREGSTEILWYQIGIRKMDAICEMEPGECEEIHADFIIEKGIQTIQIVSFFQNEVKKNKVDIGWTCTTLHDIEK
jgi:hypothetical protein